MLHVGPALWIPQTTRGRWDHLELSHFCPRAVDDFDAASLCTAYYHKMEELPQLWRSLSPSFLSFHTLCSFLTLAGHRIKDHSLSWGKKFVDIAEDNGIYRQTKSRLRELQVWRLRQGIFIYSAMRKTMCRSRKITAAQPCPAGDG